MKGAPIFIISFLAFGAIPVEGQKSREDLQPLDRIYINEALWGGKIANVLKGIPVTYDAKRGLLYSAGITSRYIAVTDPAKGHPIDAIDLGTGGFRVISLHLDAKRDRLFYVRSLDSVHKIIGVAENRLVGMRAGRDGAEILVELSPETFQLRGIHAVTSTESIRTEARIEASTMRLYITDMVNAKVHGLRAPSR